MKNKFLNLSFFLTIAAYSLQADQSPLIDFDEMVSDFVREEKQIEIQGYPDAFNPSIVRWFDGKLLLTFRTRDPSTKNANLIGFAWLNEDFEHVGDASLLTIHGDFPLKTSKAQGVRVFMSGKDCCIAYNNILSDDKPETRRMIVSKLHYANGRFFINEPQFLLSFVGDVKNWREKNWSPFDYRGATHFSYSLNPHRVFELPKSNNTCKTVGMTESKIDWPWGELHGGTPALRYEDSYLGFFHSWKDLKSVQSNGRKISHFFMGAYLFDSKPPFKLTYISREPIIGSTFFHAPEYSTWKDLEVIYPGGFIFNKEFIWVVYGRQDHECWVVKLNKKELIDSLIDVPKN